MAGFGGLSSLGIISHIVSAVLGIRSVNHADVERCIDAQGAAIIEFRSRSFCLAIALGTFVDLAAWFQACSGEWRAGSMCLTKS